MLKVVASRMAVLIAGAVFASCVSGGYANGEGDGPPVDDKKVKVKITTGEGRAKGIVDMVTHRQVSSDQHKDLWRGTSNSRKKISIKDQEIAGALCWEQSRDLGCLPATGPWELTSLTGPLARAMAIRLVASLRFPAPKPIFGPDPNNNEWKMLAVGYPVWLWTEGPTTVSTAASSNGFTFRMTARWRSTTFHMGDGSTVTCTSMTKYSRSAEPGAASPNCGHVYSKPSLPKGKYQVRAVADWDVTWSVAGFSGVIPAYNEASASIPIGELVALNR